MEEGQPERQLVFPEEARLDGRRRWSSVCSQFLGEQESPGQSFLHFTQQASEWPAGPHPQFLILRAENLHLEQLCGAQAFACLTLCRGGRCPPVGGLSWRSWSWAILLCSSPVTDSLGRLEGGIITRELLQNRPRESESLQRGPGH